MKMMFGRLVGSQGHVATTRQARGFSISMAREADETITI